jgi:DNA-3-methyladenine glycosylase
MASIHQRAENHLKKPAEQPRLVDAFFQRDVLQVAPELIGCVLVRSFPSGEVRKFIINEVEAYRGEEDLACHAAKGRTSRTEVMYGPGGRVYIYLIYGMYWMLNFVTSTEDIPQAVLLRGIEGYNGPGKLSRALELDKSFYGEQLSVSTRLWIEESGNKPSLLRTPRIGIDYAGPKWSGKLWRWVSKG